MAAPATTDEFLDLIRKSGVADDKRFDAWLNKVRPAGLPTKPTEAAGLLVREGVLTTFQAEQILQGKWRRFTIGKYKVLERLGSGGMASVYLCEHKLMRRRVAVKVLPTAKAQDESALERFYREARAVAALDHPNIVHAYDIDQDDSLHFLVMEYVDGASLQEMVKASGPMDVTRACHYMHQSAMGLEHAHRASLIHRDIKPGNILVDRTGVVKILDMGLARFFNDEDDMLTKKFDENVLGTADYLAPEQAVDSHDVDIRADIYGLGATFYFLLTGRTPFGEGTVAQKLLWHQSRRPKPVSEVRPEVPADVAAVVAKMMAREKEQRYQTPEEVAAALAPFVETPIGPPPDAEMPRLSPALGGAGSGGMATVDTSVVKNQAVTPTAPKALQGMSSKSHLPPPPKKTPTPVPTKAAPPRPSSPATPRPAAASAAPLVKPAPPALPSLPKPAAARPQPQPAAAVAAVEEEEEAPWENLNGADTEDPSAKADTAPRSTRSAPKLAPQTTVKNPRRAWLVVGLIGAGAALVVGGLAVYAFVNRGSGPVTPTRKTFEVTKEPGRPNSYRSIEQAMRVAEPGDIIQLLDPEYRENLHIERRMSGTHTLDVTIEAAPGRQVVWKSASKDDAKPILYLQHAKNFKINGKGLTLDGTVDDKRQVKDLIIINFESPGLTIEDATFTNFARCAVSLMNAGGAKDRPIRLTDLKTIVAPGTNPEAAVLFDAKIGIEPLQNQYIEMQGGEFSGLVAAKELSNAANGKGVILPK